MLKKDVNFEIKREELNKDTCFTNPLDTTNRADPYVIYSERDKCYYGISTDSTPSNVTSVLVLYKSKSISTLFKSGESRVIYEANDTDETYGNLWAPELYFFGGKWYIYTSTCGKDNPVHWHIICLSSKTENPLDGFVLASHINPDVRAIDPTLYHNKKDGKLYMCFALFDGFEEYLAIQEMKSFTETKGEYSIISRPEYEWERLFSYRINEGPAFVERDGRLFIVYSANGCMCDDYCLGVLELTGDNFMLSESWTKDDVPLFKKGNDVFGVGHASFFESPDRSELFVCYHALCESNPLREKRSIERYCHCQKVYFDKTGFLHIGKPLANGVCHNEPKI